MDDKITLKYGAGGQAMRSLIQQVFMAGMPASLNGNVGLAEMDDGAALRIGDRWLVMTTDSHVIHPVFFPGGDIGRLAVSGTVNDLAMMGATEVLALTCAVIIEEGFSREALVKIQRSIRDACTEADAQIVAGDTKVMGHRELDGIVLNTTGVALTDRIVRDSTLQPGNDLIVTGTIGDHGMAVMVERHKLSADGDLRSDVAPLNALIRAALESASGAVVAMKDPTRGGVASTLHEMAEKSHVGILLDESALPIRETVRAVGDLLGIDPLHVANEGKAVLGVRRDATETVLRALRAHPLGRNAAVIGRCIPDHVGAVILETGFGRRLVTEAEGEPLPRIC